MSKTFKEFLVDNPTLYNGVGYYSFNNVTQQMDFNEIDELTKTFIYDWFQDREVNSDTHFARDFKRELNKDLWQYYQYLRIQLTDFDPLVADYYEDYLQHTGESHETGTNDQTKTPGGLLKQRQTTYNNEQIAEGGSDVRRPLTTETQTTTKGITETTEVTPGVVVEESGRDVTTPQTTDTQTTTRGITETTQVTPGAVIEVTGRDVITPQTTDTQTTTRSISETTQVTPGAIIEVKSGVKEVNKAQPVSLSYAGATAGEVPDLDWTTASTQAQNESVQRTTPISGSDTTTVTPSNGQDVVTNAKTGTETKDYTKTTTPLSGHDTTVVTPGNGQDVVTNAKTGTETKEYTKTTTPLRGHDTTVVTPGNGQDVVTNATTGTDTQEYGKTSTKTGGHTEVESVASSRDEVIDQDTSKDIEDAHDDKRRHTGRQGMLPQWALQKAVEYIVNTNAYDFLYNALQPCFNWVDEL